jgi:mono/diheme cytochrome c family protein
MKFLLRIFLSGMAACLVLAVLALAYVYMASEHQLHRQYQAPLTALALPTDAASIAEGKRLARLRGCYGGCHGKTLEGRVWEDSLLGGRVVAPDLTRVARELPPEALVRTVREGVRPNGESVWDMPSNMMFHLADEDIARIIAFIRGEAALNGLPRELAYGLLQRWEIVRGNYPSMREEIEKLGRPQRMPDRADPVDFGRYLARTICSECHGPAFQGQEGSPNLHVMAQAYSPEHFATLMRTGIAVGNRKLGLMSQVARSRFAYFSDDEIAAVYAFLRSRPK